jgi:hypothetical protein
MHYYERNIVEIRNEYTNFFINMVAPLIFEGIKSIYARSLDLEKQYEEAAKKNTAIKSPGVLKIFQHFLKGIPALNINLIESELIRIRDSSKHADIFEKLIRAVFKSNIVLLTYNASGKECKLVNEKFHEKIDIKTFIHKIYIECAIQLYNNPELFWDKYSSSEIQKNHKETINIIKECIREAIIKMLPLNDILFEYLKNDYIVDPEIDQANKVRQILIDEDKHINLYNESMPILDPNDNGEDESKHLFRELNENMTNMDELILNKHSENDHYSHDKYDNRDNRDYSNKYEEHNDNGRMNTEEEYKSRINKEGYTFDLLNRKPKNNKPKVEQNNNDNRDNRDNRDDNKFNKNDNGIVSESNDFNVQKQKIVEDKINKINPKEYYNSMFV